MTTPARFRALLVFFLVAALAWGAVSTWTVLRHASAAGNVVAVSEPLSLDAQRMYRSLADADVTAATAFLRGPDQPLTARRRYAADIAEAAASLSALKGGAAGNTSNQRLLAGLATISAGLPVYTGYVAQAQTDYALGYMLTGGSLMQVASEQMHLTLLPAARGVYARETDALAAQSAQATGLPWTTVVIVLAVVIGLALAAAQRWLARRTHRLVNAGLLIASAALVASTVWLAAAFAVARSDLQQAGRLGSAPAELLAQAAISAQQARGDEVLNLISRSGDAPFEQDFQAIRARLGPGPGTLLTRAGQAGAAGPAARAWYDVNDQAYRLDSGAQYAAETRLVTGTGPSGSAAQFSQLEGDLGHAITADQLAFRSSAAAGRAAFGGLAAGVIVAAILMAAASAWGLARRLAEYR